jgi:hypothetical protein
MIYLRRIVFGLMLVLGILVANSCGNTDDSKKSRSEVPNQDIVVVMNDHVDSLMAIPGVTGVAVGELKDRTPCIQVLIIKDTKEIRISIPTAIAGHPVDIIVSGEIRPMDAK